MRSTNSRSRFGTHHIFFPPRLEVVGGENDSDGLASDFGRDASADGLLGHEADRPSRAPFRSGTAHHRNDGCALHTVESRLGLAAWIVGQRGFQATREVALPHAGYFPWKGADRFRRRSH